MSALSFADTLFALRFVRLLTMPYEKTAAFKTGAIDKDGKTLLSVSEMSQEQKESYTLFHRLVFNLRRLLQKVPIAGRSILTNYATAILMLREASGIDENIILNAIEESTNISFRNISEENGKQLLPNYKYRLIHSLPHKDTGELLFKEGSEVLVISDVEPSIFEIRFYEAIHVASKQHLLVCEGDVSVSPSNTVELIPPHETKDMIFPPKKKGKKKNEKIRRIV